MHRFLLAAIVLAAFTCAASARIQTKTIEYKDGDLVLEGFMAWDDAQTDSPRPGVLIVHQWMGLTDYEKGRAKQLAELGYVAFALDIYGKNERPANRQEAGAKAGKFKGDRKLFRKRLKLGFDQMLAGGKVDKQKTAAIGYCFGGTGVIELARSGAAVNGVVSFHGGLDSPTPADGRNITAKILICHGADDPFVKQDDIDAMIAEFDDAGVDWQMISYSNAVHSFTQPMAGNDKSRGAAYEKKADERSWQHMRTFLTELFE